MIPYYPLSDEVIGADHQAAAGPDREARSAENHKIPFTYDDDVIELIIEPLHRVESGGRMIDAILTNTLLPAISKEFLTRMMEGQPVEKVHVKVEEGDFGYAFESHRRAQKHCTPRPW